MKPSAAIQKLVLLALACLPAALRAQVPAAPVYPPCSTEIVNNDCLLTIDRYYPVALPTVQLRQGKVIRVQIVHPLPFEMLSLDLQSASAIAGTDPTSAMITNLIGNAKSLLVSTNIRSGSGGGFQALVERTPQFMQAMAKVNAIKAALDQVEADAQNFGNAAVGVYSEISEVAGVIPPDELQSGQRPAGSPLTARNTPIPWRVPTAWKNWMLCELAGCPNGINPNPAPNLQGLLGTAANLANELTAILTTCPPALPTSSAYSGSNIDCAIRALYFTDTCSFLASEVAQFTTARQSLSGEFAALGVANTALGNLVKDLGSNYLVNLQQWTAPADLIVPANAPPPVPPPVMIGQIPDPGVLTINGTSIAKLLGRQVTFAADAVNQITTPTASVITATQKKSFAAITVLFADPKVEASAGTFFSFLPNRSFANQTAVMQNPGMPPTPENVLIQQTITRPTVIPFAAANVRLGHDFLVGNRRSAFYWTGAIGVNPYNSTTEFATGPTFSWRSLMFSAFAHIGLDVRLTQGETVGEVWCNQTAAVGSIGKCAGSPPSPTTEKYWTPAFAIGVSVRVPSLFGGTGR